MPRASWNGFLRLSLVTCPVYLTPATTDSKRIRFNQLNAETGNRLRQQLVDAETGEVVERDGIAKGYEYSRGQYVTVDDEELKALQIESSKIIDLTQFVSRDDVDPVYLDAPYYVYPQWRSGGRGVPSDRRGDGGQGAGGDRAGHHRQPRAVGLGGGA
jgi:DNA end-binding protein Ku